MSVESNALRMPVMIPLFCVVAIDAIGMGVILPLLPFYSQHFGASPLAIGALVAVFSLGQLVAAPVLGKLSDRFGRKAVLLGSQIGTLLSLVMLATAGNLTVVFLARILDGLTAGNLSVAIAYAADHSTPATRRRAIGMVSAAVGVGMMVGPSLSAGLAHISIAAPIWGAVVLSGLSVIVNQIFLRADKTSLAATDKPKGSSLWGTLRSPQTVSVLSVLALFYFGFAMYVSQFALFLQARYSWGGIAFGPREVGYIFAASGAINIVVQAVAMKQIERVIPENFLTASSLLLFSVGLGIFTLLQGIPALVVGLVVASVGTALSRPALMASLSMTSSPQQQGAIMGANTSLMAICNIVAPLVAGALIDQGKYLGWVIVIAAILAVSSCLTFIFIKTKRWPDSPTMLSPYM